LQPFSHSLHPITLRLAEGAALLTTVVLKVALAEDGLSAPGSGDEIRLSTADPASSDYFRLATTMTTTTTPTTTSSSNQNESLLAAMS